MLKCDDAGPLIARSVDGDITPRAAVRLRQHLDACPVCTAEIDAQREIRRILSSRTDIALPAGFAARLSRRLDEEQDAGWLERGNWRQWGVWLMPAAAALVLAAFVAEANHEPVVTTADVQTVVTSWATESGDVTALLADPETDESLMEELMASPATNGQPTESEQR